jgi:hypothetical protein
LLSKREKVHHHRPEDERGANHHQHHRDLETAAGHRISLKANRTEIGRKNEGGAEIAVLTTRDRRGEISRQTRKMTRHATESTMRSTERAGHMKKRKDTHHRTRAPSDTAQKKSLAKNRARAGVGGILPTRRKFTRKNTSEANTIVIDLNSLAYLFKNQFQ